MVRAKKQLLRVQSCPDVNQITFDIFQGTNQLQFTTLNHSFTP